MQPTPETELSYLGFQRLVPGPALRSYIREYWYFRRDTPLLAYHEEFMHPRGGFGIVFNFGDALRLDHTQIVIDPIFLDGANTVSRQIGFLGRIDLLGVRFHEGGAYPFLGLPLNYLRNETGLLDALEAPELLRLHARLADAGTLPTRVSLLEEWLIGRLSFGKEQHVLIPTSLAMLRQRAGTLAIPDLARSLAISQRQLERLYQSQVGMSPKQYSQLLRIEAARLALKQINHQTTTNLAANLGFYDQAHFIREFQAVIGMTPYAYMNRSRQKSKDLVHDAS
jgi:AraC-like DNA-binding protein